MPHNIDVDAHLKRYQQTDLSDVVKLINGLQNMIEARKGETISKLKAQLSLLEEGIIPEEPAKPVTARKPRGKKITATAEEDQQDQ